MLESVSRIVLGILFVLAGTMHFVRPKVYLRMMPPWIPWHAAAVYVSGAAEILLGIGVLVPATTRWAAWGLIALLVAVFPANVFMFQKPERFPKVPRVLLALRLPLQAVLIAWALWHTGVV